MSGHNETELANALAQACQTFHQKGNDAALLALRKQLTGRLMEVGHSLIMWSLQNKQHFHTVYGASLFEVFQFHACLLIVKGVAAEFTSLPKEKKTQLLSALFSTIRTMDRTTLHPSAYAQLCRASALMLKLFWLKGDQEALKTTLLEEMVSEQRNLLFSLELLEAITEEHSVNLSSSTGLNIPVGEHLEARRRFIANGWKKAYQFGTTAVKHVMQQLEPGSIPATNSTTSTFLSCNLASSHYLCVP